MTRSEIKETTVKDTRKVEVQWWKTKFYQIVPRKGSGKRSTR